MEKKDTVFPAENELQLPGHKGHRERMRQRYRQSGLADFEDHEVLEMLLFQSIPRRNTNPLAHTLLDTYGSMEAVLESGGNISGIGWKTQRFLQNTWDGLTECFLKTILPADDAKPICPDRSQFYTAAVWFLRRYPEHILLLVCSETGEPEEVGIIGDAAFSALGTALRTAVSGASAAGKKYCHLACIGRREEMTALRQDGCSALLGMLLSVTSRWEPVWL